MKLSSVLAAIALPALAAAERILQTSSLNICQENLGFSAKLFNLVYFPDNNTATVDIDAVSSVEGSVVFDVSVIVYGYQLLRTTVDPCKLQLGGLCPMTSGEMFLKFALPIPDGADTQVPGIAYVVPDLDAVARIYLNNSQTGVSLACVEADISNGKTVDLLGVKWATAAIAGLALLCAAFVSGLGHLNAAAHIAANALALFSYFQAQAIIGMTGVTLPPLVQAWTQDFQWSMGIIRVGWMQNVFRWYQRSTGGAAARLLDSLGDVSVQVEKRSLDVGVVEGVSMFKRATAMAAKTVYRRAAAAAAAAGSAGLAGSGMAIAKRGNIMTETGSFIVFGIQRVAFKAGIETTNLFMTGLTFFVAFCVLTAVCVATFRAGLELATSRRWISADKFIDFRSSWLTVLKGILFRLTLIGFPQMTILCLWEFTQVDSPAEVTLAVFFLFGMIATLAWAAFKVVRLARRSIALYRTPAYVLFSDPKTLNKWGFLYIQFRASAYYFILPVLAYTVVKSMIVALGQNNGVGQAVSFIIVEAAALIAASVLRPWMDKTTNSLNIAISVVNFLNAICLLIFTNVFGLPGLVVGILGVILVLLNVVMSFVLLIMIIVKTTLVFFRKNPDAKYQFMADDRASFMKSSTHLDTTTELDALAATARGEKGNGAAGFGSYGQHSGSNHNHNQLDLDDGESIRSVDSGRGHAAANVPLPPSSAGSVSGRGSHSQHHSAAPSRTGTPVGASSAGAAAGMLPMGGAGSYAPLQQDRPRSPGASSLTQGYPSSLRGQPRSNSPYGAAASGGSGSSSRPPPGQGGMEQQYRPQTSGSGRSQAANASPWQRGAGYD